MRRCRRTIGPWWALSTRAANRGFDDIRHNSSASRTRLLCFFLVTYEALDFVGGPVGHPLDRLAAAQRRPHGWSPQRPIAWHGGASYGACSTWMHTPCAAAIASPPSFYCRVFAGKARFEAACGRLVPTADRRSTTRVRSALSAIVVSEARKFCEVGTQNLRMSLRGRVSRGFVRALFTASRFDAVRISAPDFRAGLPRAEAILLPSISAAEPGKAARSIITATATGKARRFDAHWPVADTLDAGKPPPHCPAAAVAVPQVGDDVAGQHVLCATCVADIISLLPAGSYTDAH